MIILFLYPINFNYFSNYQCRLDFHFIVLSPAVFSGIHNHYCSVSFLLLWTNFIYFFLSFNCLKLLNGTAHPSIYGEHITIGDFILLAIVWSFVWSFQWQMSIFAKHFSPSLSLSLSGDHRIHMELINLTNWLLIQEEIFCELQ